MMQEGRLPTILEWNAGQPTAEKTSHLMRIAKMAVQRVPRDALT
jgi:hypothetical protein